METALSLLAATGLPSVIDASVFLLSALVPLIALVLLVGRSKHSEISAKLRLGPLKLAVSSKPVKADDAFQNHSPATSSRGGSRADSRQNSACCCGSKSSKAEPKVRAK